MEAILLVGGKGTRLRPLTVNTPKPMLPVAGVPFTTHQLAQAKAAGIAVNIGKFVSEFNDRTKEMRGVTIPVVITIFSDRSFTFETKSPPAAVLLKQAAGIPIEKKKGSELLPAEEKEKGTGKYKGFKVTKAQVKEIAKRKFVDLNARDEEHAVRIIEGTARSMGITVEG